MTATIAISLGLLAIVALVLLVFWLGCSEDSDDDPTGDGKP